MLGKILQEKNLYVYWGIALLLTVILTVLANPGLLGQPFSWVSAHFSTMARTFAELGVGFLGGVPIQNNPPLTSQPDAYLHFPPLLPILLSAVFRFWGASDTVAYLSMLVLTLATSLAVYFLVAAIYDKKAGLFSAFAFLTLPVMFTYGHLVMPLRLALLLMLIALFFYIKAITVESYRSRLWLGLGAVTFALSVFASWEPLLLCPSLLAYAFIRSDHRQRRSALLYSLAGGLSVLGIFGMYAFQYPDLIAELWSVVGYRTGLIDYSAASSTLHQLHPEYQHEREGLWLLRVVYTFIERLALLGNLGLLALILITIYCWAKPNPGRYQLIGLVMISLAGVWLLWAVLMMQHFLHHEYEWTLAAPPAAIALGITASWLMNIAYTLRDGSQKVLMLLMSLIALPIILLHPQLVYTLDTIAASLIPSKTTAESLDLVKYGIAIRSATPPGSIVLSPSADMTPVFYSERHTIVGLTGDGVLLKILPELYQKFNSYPIYLAFPPSEAQRFTWAMQNYQIVARKDNLVLLDMAQPNAKPH